MNTISNTVAVNINASKLFESLFKICSKALDNAFQEIKFNQLYTGVMVYRQIPGEKFYHKRINNDVKCEKHKKACSKNKKREKHINNICFMNHNICWITFSLCFFIYNIQFYHPQFASNKFS